MSCSTSTCPSQSGAGADADGGNGERRRDPLGQRGRQQLEHDGARPRLLERLASASSRSAAGCVAALHPVAAERVHRLGREPEVADHGNAPVHERAHRLRHRAAALELDAVRAGLLQHAARVADRFRRSTPGR